MIGRKVGTGPRDDGATKPEDDLPDGYCTLTEAERLAKTLDVWADRPLIAKAARTGLIPGCYKAGHRWRLPVDEVRKWLSDAKGG